MKCGVLVVAFALSTGAGCSSSDGSDTSEGAVDASFDAGAESAAGAAGCEGLSGPEMVEVTTPSGAAYCIDRTKVTESQYRTFLENLKTRPFSEHPECPPENYHWPVQNLGSIEGAVCKEGNFAPSAYPDYPVTCITWCDAHAYCNWAGKRLCGSVSGGTVTNPAAMADAEKSQWYGACSQGGTTKYAYGDSYDPTVCSGGIGDVASEPGCHGTIPPYSAIFDLGGSVYELTDECATDPTSEYVSCMARNGASPPSGDIGCDAGGSWDRGQVADWAGFRCCKDL